MKRTETIMNLIPYIIAVIAGFYFTFKLIPVMELQRGGFYIGGEWLLPVLFVVIVHILQLAFDVVEDMIKK